MTVVIGTAGHVDHGKTTLLRALTGIDADRLPEERRRGLTIDIGYAHGSPDGGPVLDYVDVPGHDRLLGNMLVGVGEIDAALLVIAADDGPRAQTWEHLGLLDAMGVDLAVVAITKIDNVDAERVSAVTARSADTVAGTRLAGSPFVAVSAQTGQGLDELRAALATLRDRVSDRRLPPRAGAWLAIDRAFIVRGHGVVATGSSRGGQIRTGDDLEVRPGRVPLRVRAVHIHDVVVDVAGRGRVALNLAGVELDGLDRGQILTSPMGQDGVCDVFDTRRLLVALQRPADVPGRARNDPWPPRDGVRLRLHIGTDQLEARLSRSGRIDDDTDGGMSFAVLQLGRDVAAAIGERFVLRRPPPAGLLAGGIVLDADVPAGRARSRLQRDRLMRLYGAAREGRPDRIESALVELHGVRGPRLAPDVDAAVETALMNAAETHHRLRPDAIGLESRAARAAAAAALRTRVAVDETTLASITDDAIQRALARGTLEQDGDSVRRPGFQPSPADPAIARQADALVVLLDQDAPPALSAAAAQTGCSSAVIRELERQGRIVLVGDDLGWSAGAFQRNCDLALALARRGPMTPAALRDATGTSRKYVMALLGECDRRGILKRTPEGHVPGPRA